jgi:hypothetical protein
MSMILNRLLYRALSNAFLGSILFSSGTTAQTTAEGPPDEGKVAAIVAAADCYKGPWKVGDDGHAPRAYLAGIGLMYLKSFCEVKKNKDAASKDMSRTASSKPTDIFAYYVDAFTQNGVSLASDLDRLRAVYTLGIAVGMNETNGNASDGPYIKDNQNQAEAGLFQMSYDSLVNSKVHHWSPWLESLYNYYKQNGQLCLLSTFMKGIPDKNLAVVGTGAAADFQSFTKSCPAFATEYAMVMMRVQANYFGTIIGTNPGGHSNKALFVPACYQMLSKIEAQANCEN